MLSMLFYDAVFLPNAVQFVFHVLSLHTCFHFKNQWMQFFSFGITAYLVTIERFSICVAPTVSAHGGCGFPYFVIIL